MTVLTKNTQIRPQSLLDKKEVKIAFSEKGIMSKDSIQRFKKHSLKIKNKYILK